MSGTRRVWLGTAALFGLLALAYTASIGMRASRSAEISGDEPFYLATTQSLIDDRNFDLREQYERQSYLSFFDHPDGLWKQALADEQGRLMSPHDPGLSVLLVPGFALGGLRGAQIELLLIAAATFALAFAYTVIEFGHPRTAWLMTAVVGLAAPGFVYSTEVYPEMPAALCLVAALLTIRAPAGYARSAAMLAALTALAWLGVKYVPLGAIVATAYLWRAPSREQVTFAAGAAASTLVYIAAYLALFGALTPYNGNLVNQGATTVSVVHSQVGLSDRAYRVWGLFVDERFGLGHWAPILLAVVPGLPLLLDRASGRLIAALVATQILVASFVAVTMMGWWFPGRHLMVVYPLFPIVLTVAAARLPARLAPLWSLLGAWSLAITAALAVAGHRGQVRTAVDPFDLRSQVFRALNPLFPNYTWWDTETRLLTAAWVTIMFGLAALAAIHTVRGIRSREITWRAARTSPSPTRLPSPRTEP